MYKKLYTIKYPCNRNSNLPEEDAMYELSSKELLETGIATEIISCQ